MDARWADEQRGTDSGQKYHSTAVSSQLLLGFGLVSFRFGFGFLFLFLFWDWVWSFDRDVGFFCSRLGDRWSMFCCSPREEFTRVGFLVALHHRYFLFFLCFFATNYHIYLRTGVRRWRAFPFFLRASFFFFFVFDRFKSSRFRAEVGDASGSKNANNRFRP